MAAVLDFCILFGSQSNSGQLTIRFILCVFNTHSVVLHSMYHDCPFYHNQKKFQLYTDCKLNRRTKREYYDLLFDGYTTRQENFNIQVLDYSREKYTRSRACMCV